MHFKVDPIIRRTVSYFSLIKAITTTTSNIIIVVLTIAIAIIIILFCTNVKASLCEGHTCHLSLGPEVYTQTHSHTQTVCNACNSYLYLKLFVYLSASLSLFFSPLLVLKFDFLSHKPLVTLAFRIDLPIHNCHTAWLKFYLFIIIFPHIFYCCSFSLSLSFIFSLLLRWPVAHAYCQLTLPLSLPLSLFLFRKGKVSSLKLASIDFESCIKMQFGQKQQRKKTRKRKALVSLSAGSLAGKWLDSKCTFRYG